MKLLYPILQQMHIDKQQHHRILSHYNKAISLIIIDIAIIIPVQ